MADHSATTDHHDGEHGDHPHVKMSTFVMVFLTLCVLTVISFGAAYLVQPPQLSWAIMLAVSCAKAMLVIAFFMHLIWEASWKYVLTIPASLMSVLLVLLLVPDVGRRTRTYSEERWRYAAEPEVVEHTGHEEGETAAGEVH